MAKAAFKKMGQGVLCLGVAGVILLPPAAMAQMDAITSAQQLPPEFAAQQVPPAFGQAEAPPQAIPQPTPLSEAMATQAPPQQAAAQAPADQPAQEILAQNEPQGQGQGQVKVPSTQMGAGAVVENPEEIAPMPSSSEGLSPALPDGAMMDIPSDPPALPADILEQYGSDPNAAMGDALPAVDTTTMDRLNEVTGAANEPVDPALKAYEEELAKKAYQEGIRKEAYDAALTGLFPMTTDQIQDLLKTFDETQKATAKTPYEPPKPEISVQNVSLDPGVMPLTIKTAVGNVTTLNILDATGAPWPVQDVTWAGDFEVVEPEEGGHIIRITPMGHFARGNIVIRLLTLKTPLTMTLETSREVVQYRVDARIPEYGPMAQAPLIAGASGRGFAAGDTTMTSLLDGVMPTGMTKLNVAGVDGRTSAYFMNGMTYVRTPMTLLSPAWQNSMTSADGMNVYALVSAPVVLLSDNGNFVRATLTEKEDLLDE